MLLSRRFALAWLGFTGAAALPLLAADAKTQHSLVYVGTYTGGQSKGIYAFRFDSATGKLSPLGLAAETRNPSFVAISPSGKYLYAANEIGDYNGEKSGSVTAFSLDSSSGKLTQLNTVSSHGASPCYVITDKTGKVLLVANYMGGSFSALPIGADGRLAEASTVIQDAGSGPAKNQDGPHAHSLNASPDNRFAIGADLGLDKLLVFKLDAGTGKLVANSPDSVHLEPGSGPRHFAFHPSVKFAYSINELKSTITALSYEQSTGGLTPLQSISTLPKDFSGQNSTAHIAVHPNGKFVYGSNRGHDSIAVFAVESTKGTLTPVEIVPTTGRTPRNFSLDPSGNFLLVANQASNNIVIFRVDPATGRLTATGETASVGTPVCVKFLPLD